MRIGINFHSSDTYISGVEYYCLGLLSGLLRNDNENQYLVFTNQPGLVSQYSANSTNLDIRNLSHLRTRPQRIFWEHQKLATIARKEKLDILHCPEYIGPFSGFPRYVVTIHDTIAIDHPELCKLSNAIYYRILMRHTVKKASRIIAVSNATAENLVRNFKVNSSRVRVIYPGIESIFNTQANYSLREDIVVKYNLPERYILFVGNVEPKKNILTILQAYKLLKDKPVRHKLVLAGKRSWKSRNIFRYLRDNFSSEDVIILGYVDRQELPFIYKMADVLVSVSLVEGFGFPVLEAMACGTAVAASKAGILKEISEKAFCFLETRNPEQIAQVLYSLLTNSKLRQNQIEIGKKASCRFNWDISAKMTLSLYKEVMEDYE